MNKKRLMNEKLKKVGLWASAVLVLTTLIVSGAVYAAHILAVTLPTPTPTTVSEYNEFTLPVLDSCGIITDGQGHGSCVAIGPDILLTAAHCLEHVGLWVEVAGHRYEVVEQYTSKIYDVGFVRIDGILHYVELGKMPQLLDKVYIVGTPREIVFLNLITSGIICKLGIQYSNSTVNWVGDFICDAAAWCGMSGGPVLNEQWQLVGMYVGLFYDVDNFSVCVPVTQVRAALDEYYNLDQEEYE